ncbi:FKBP-type peptidyl-prolyl cis-trans isomerase [Rodentibacter caecimuris]|uniref:Peptidyl-prolyl cis-trans isomerase n=1 Tax=Rodentibacter caecimuris TaxID=1796644 RepID=A0ABX3KXA4_9PAST|nr:peptidylprolyl isomerase [Rodentibacter heylii]
MLKIQKLTAVSIALSAVISGAVFADTKSNDSLFNDEVSYALSAYSIMQAKLLAEQTGVKLNANKVSDAVSDVLNNKIDKKKIADIEKTLASFQEKAIKEAEAKAAEAAKKAKEEGDKYRAEFAKKADVKTTNSGLLYRIVEQGKGDAIKATDTVKVHYTGKLPNGTVFDSSYKRGQPAEFRLDQVIQGWTEGLQLIKKGGKIELVIPPEIAYGDADSGIIPANSTLYFDVEVLDVKSGNKN